MAVLQRREFLKLAGAGAGAMVASGLFADRLAAGEPPSSGLGIFEERFGVTAEELRKVLQAALSKGGDFADLYLEYTTSNQVEMEDDIIKESDEDIRLGVGIRVLKGQKTGYGYTSELELAAMRRAALTAAAIASSGGAGAIAPLSARARRPPGLPVEGAVRGGIAGGPHQARHGGLQRRCRARQEDREGPIFACRRAAVRDDPQQ